MQDTCRRRHRVSLLVGAVAAGLLVVGLAIPTAKAATASGWTIVTGAPVNQQNSNLLLGSTCSNSWNCWAVGGTFVSLNGGGGPSSLVEHWNGTSWTVGSGATIPGSTASLLWDVTCVTGSDCWAVGVDEPGNSGDPSPLAEQWNGSTWSVVPTPDLTGYLFSVTCVTSSDCWAAGTTATDDGNSDPLNGFILHWDGTSWSTTPTQPSGQTYDQFNSVTCTSASDCWAVGFAGPNAESNNFLPNVMPNVAGDGSLVEHWNGAAWTRHRVPLGAQPLGHLPGRRDLYHLRPVLGGGGDHGHQWQPVVHPGRPVERHQLVHGSQSQPVVRGNPDRRHLSRAPPGAGHRVPTASRAARTRTAHPAR